MGRPKAMPVGDLIAGLPLAVRRGASAAPVSGLADDSRRVVAGGAFIARGGAGGNGRQYVDDAVKRGAAAIIDVTGPSEPADATGEIVWISAAHPLPDTGEQGLTGQLADRFFGEPSARLDVLGVTGTNGKTTIAFLTRHLLAAAGRKCGLLSTVCVDLGDPAGPTPATLTTPGAIEVHRSFAAMVDNGCRAVAMECSSHALAQRRVDAVRFDAAIFTNLTGDHLDYHGTMEAYAGAKARLFGLLDNGGAAVLNLESAYWQTMRPARGRVIGTTLGGADRAAVDDLVRAEVLEQTARGSRVRVDGPWGEHEIDLPLVGRHNVSNAIQAAAAVWAVTGLNGDALAEALRQSPPVPGRLEPVAVDGVDGPVVLVDYAHTDDALDNALQAVRQVAPGRVTVVFGCGGDRDRTKRPRMAGVACRWADRVVVTSDNPRSEDPQRIIGDVLAGVPGDRRGAVVVEPDRAAAIARAIAEADLSDTVVLAGKGHEDYQILADGRGGTYKIAFDDRQHAGAALRQRRRLEETRA